MAELLIKMPEAAPGERGVQLTFDEPVPPPAFVEIEDENGVNRYLPASLYEAERELNRELVEALGPLVTEIDDIMTFTNLTTAATKARNTAKAALAKAKAREKGDD